jgi:hypothetical protein
MLRIQILVILAILWVARGAILPQPQLADDDPLQRAALLDLAAALGAAPQNLPPVKPGQQAWGAANSSYCAWRGVSCCAGASALLPLPCFAAADVVALNFTATGLRGGLPGRLGAPLESTLQLLMLGDNPGLEGDWPESLEVPRLLLLDVQVGAAGLVGDGVMGLSACGVNLIPTQTHNPTEHVAGRLPRRQRGAAAMEQRRQPQAR